MYSAIYIPDQGPGRLQVAVFQGCLELSQGGKGPDIKLPIHILTNDLMQSLLQESLELQEAIRQQVHFHFQYIPLLATATDHCPATCINAILCLCTHVSLHSCLNVLLTTVLFHRCILL